MQSWMERRPAGQVRTEQGAQVLKVIQFSYLPRLGWPEALLELWGWIEWDLEPGRHLAPSLSEQESHWRDYPETGRSGLPSRYPTVVCSGRSPFQCPSFRQKAPWFQPRWLPGSLLDLFTPPGSPLHSRLIRADKRCNFLLASCPYWPPLLSLSCYRP